MSCNCGQEPEDTVNSRSPENRTEREARIVLFPVLKGVIVLIIKRYID